MNSQAPSIPPSHPLLSLVQSLTLWGLLFLPPWPVVPGYSCPARLALCALPGSDVPLWSGVATAGRGLVWERLRWLGMEGTGWRREPLP